MHQECSLHCIVPDDQYIYTSPLFAPNTNKNTDIWKYKKNMHEIWENELHLPYKATVGAAFGCRSIYSLPLFVPQRCGA